MIAQEPSRSLNQHMGSLTWSSVSTCFFPEHLESGLCSRSWKTESGRTRLITRRRMHHPTHRTWNCGRMFHVSRDTR
ncbi:hypothetical protein GE21DRAFT_1207918 [Neurospora crassa]|nr:hypothetical protein GE21DRAFT_1207918 [Neurospora crassa]